MKTKYIIFPILLLFTTIFVEIYSFQILKGFNASKYVKRFWIFINILIYGYAVYTVFFSSSKGQTPYTQFAMGLWLLFFLPKAIIVIIMLGEDFYRLIERFFINKTHIPSRRKFISQLALGLASIPFGAFLYGMIQGKYNYKVLKYDLEFDDLPDEFDDFTITQISDIHSGSFTNPDKIQYGVDLINEQKSDLLLFTGDIVNSFAYEMNDYIDMFSKLDAKFGKFSILGNHDYGDYAKWNSKEDKKANFNAIKDIHKKIGFKLMLNESLYLNKGNEKIALVAVENWGKGFKEAGDLNISKKGINQEDFKVLMSHDPSHWEEIVRYDDFNYQLTLSGHTHGLQMGIEIPGFIKWSPVKLKYKHWAGIYKENNRYINVNRGFGYHAFPGRVGIWPEITVIRLKKKKNV